MRNKKIYGGILFVTLVIALFWESALIRTLFAYEVLMLPLLFLQAEYFARNLESRSTRSGPICTERTGICGGS